MLILETSTEKGLIALSEGEKVSLFKFLPGGPELSKTLALEIKNLLNNRRPDCIAVGVGPGSYTGIRVSVALAKALSLAWNIPLTSFCSLNAFAPNDSTPVFVDARMGGFYVLENAHKPATLLSPQEALTTFKDAPLLASPHPNLIQKRFALPTLWVETAPDPERIAPLVFDQFLAGNFPPLHLSYLTSP